MLQGVLRIHVDISGACSAPQDSIMMPFSLYLENEQVFRTNMLPFENLNILQKHRHIFMRHSVYMKMANMFFCLNERKTNC